SRYCYEQYRINGPKQCENDGWRSESIYPRSRHTVGIRMLLMAGVTRGDNRSMVHRTNLYSRPAETWALRQASPHHPEPFPTADGARRTGRNRRAGSTTDMVGSGGCPAKFFPNLPATERTERSLAPDSRQDEIVASTWPRTICAGRHLAVDVPTTPGDGIGI